MENFDTNTVTSCILNVIFGESPRVHFVGVLGAGMLPLAMLLSSLGVDVSGTDRQNPPDASPLFEGKIDFLPYHTDKLLLDAKLVVYSLAIPEDAPELKYAKRHGIPTVTRAQLLGAIASRYKTSIAVAGTHGKSTTVAILTHILLYAGLNPTVISGASLMTGKSLLIGGDSVFIAEACEYKNAFHAIKPTVALITNIDHDHVDCFPDMESVYSAFHTFALSADTRILNLSCESSRRLCRELSDGVITYGTGGADYALVRYSLGAYQTEFLLEISGALYTFALPVSGLGCMYDAIGAIAAAHRLGVPVSKIRDAVASFCGIGRRLEYIGSINGRSVYYDYAHHPTEILNTVDVLTRRHGEIAVIFRPHTYSRTAALMDGFVNAFSSVKCLALLDVFAAREIPDDGATSQSLATAVGAHATVTEPKNALDYVLSHSAGAIVLMGAGEVDGVLSDIKVRLDK